LSGNSADETRNKNKILSTILDADGDKLLMDDRKADGLRRSAFHILSETEIEYLKNEIKIIGADENAFVFNSGFKTSYSDDLNIIRIKGDVIPDTTSNSTHPRDLMSERAVLAHEYYGHYKYAPSKFEQGDWRDEFRASYMAAKKTPNLTFEDRRYLILDALERAREAGVTIKNNNFIRRILYGYKN